MGSHSESRELSHARQSSPECWRCSFAESFDAFKTEMIGLNKEQTAEIHGRLDTLQAELDGKLETIASELRLHRWFFLAFLSFLG